MEMRNVLGRRSALLWMAAMLPVLLAGCTQAQETTRFKSTEVHADRTVTFRYKAPAANKVLLELAGKGEPLPMTKDRDRVWSVVTPPLAPEIYGYSFQVDGVTQMDPGNPAFVPNLLFPGNMVSVTGDKPQLWEDRNVPHGEVHHHFYTTKVVEGLPEGQSNYFVYTPPGYDAKRAKAYPVLYLLHGWSDMANAWTEVGKANFILDNLIAEGKVQPMVVVMPLGYGEMKFVSGDDGVWKDATGVQRNVSLFTEVLLSEILPRVEAAYHVSKNRNERAIAGLSMGGLESLSIGLNHAEQFAWVGGFSSAVRILVKDPNLSNLNEAKANLKLLWIACGTEDDLIALNRELIAWLKSKDVAVTAVETPGMHNWMVWRDNLAHFAPLLFQKK